LAVLAGLAVIALAALAVAQTDWVGTWIGQHGRVKSKSESPAAPEVLGELEVLDGTRG
jgi:hypothetical protein